MDSVTDSTAGPNPNSDNPNKRHSSSSSSSQNVYEKKPKAVIGTAISLGEDELSLIFKNACLTTRDLLNFRFVSKTWLNAATSTLLRRDACVVSLNNERQVDQNDYRRGTQISSKDLFKSGDHSGILTLTQLTDVMSKSPKFPASHFCIWARDPNSVASIPTPCCGIDYLKHAGLHTFFQLHGAKVKTFQPFGDLALEPFVANLSSYAPNVEVLDLQCTTIIPSKNLSKLTSPRCISVKSLTLGSGYRHSSQIIHLLLSALPNLNSITNIQMETLPLILNEGKGHLIRSFEWVKYSYYNPETSMPMLLLFVLVKPQISKIKLGELDLSRFGISDCISALLEASRGSLQKLELFIHPIGSENKLRLCRMEQLQCLILRGTLGSVGYVVDKEGAYSIFEDRMSAQECFPSLVKICLIWVNFEKVVYQFFQFQSTQVSVTGTAVNNKSCPPNVKVLEIDEVVLKLISDSSLISQFFPNLRMLKMECRHFTELSSSFWLQFSCVKFLEISIKPWCDSDLDGDVSSFSDIFFTGFSSEMCSKLRTTELPESLNNAQGLKSLRLSPSVCDLLHLKELKLKVSAQLWAEFASRVTGIYAFSHMPNTQFIISYDPDSFKWKRGSLDDGIDHAEMCFGSIKPYVQIVHEKWIY